jgi:PRC-barrel domain
MRHLSAAAAAIILAGIFAAPSAGDELLTKPAALKPAATDTAPAPFLTILDSWQAETILGKEVRSKANEKIGRIVDVIADRNGKVRAALIDFGGFLGVGSRKIAVDWNALKFTAGNDGRNVVTLDLTRDQMKSAPEYKEKRAVVVLGADSPTQITPSQ